MRPYQKHLIVPSARGGLDVDGNVSFWTPSIVKAYESIFANLTPSEAQYFLRLISISGVHINQIRLQHLRALAVIFQAEEDIRDERHSHDYVDILITALEKGNSEQTPSIVKERLQVTVHHIMPTSRHPDNEFESNKALWPLSLHSAYHHIFENLTLEEAVELVILINHPARYINRRELTKLRNQARRIIFFKHRALAHKHAEKKKRATARKKKA